MIHDREVFKEVEQITKEFPNLILFSFPNFNLMRQDIPGASKQSLWLRNHVEEGVVGMDAVRPSSTTVLIDTRLCPLFGQPYTEDSGYLGEIIAKARTSGQIQSLVNWGADERMLMPAGSRFGLSVAEIQNVIVPAAAKLFGGQLLPRLPRISELLFIKDDIFSKQIPNNKSYATKEWTQDFYYDVSHKTDHLGNLYLSSDTETTKSGGVHWWFKDGPDNRLPTLGFRLFYDLTPFVK